MIIAVYIASVCADIVSTIFALRRPGLREGGFLRFAGRAWIAVRIGLAVLIAVLWYVFDAPDWVLWVATGIYFAVAAWNVVQVRRAK